VQFRDQRDIAALRADLTDATEQQRLGPSANFVVETRIERFTKLTNELLRLERR
jgi:hypothetical protein